MGYQIIKQPDGKFCVWSTYVDSIVITDATADELVEHFAEQAAEDSRRRQTRNLIAKVESGVPRAAYYQFQMTYEEAVAKSRDPLP